MDGKILERVCPVFVGWYDSSESPHFRSDETYGRRIVPHYEVEYIVSSCSGYILTEDIPILTMPHAVLFRRPGMVVEGIGVYQSLVTEFDLNPAGETIDIFEALPPIFLETEDFANEALFRSLCLSDNSSGTQQLLWKARILHLLAALLENTEVKSPAAQEDGHHLLSIQQAMVYVRQNYASNITLERLADISGYSSWYFCRLFKSVTKLTPMQYVVRYRMEQARKQLLLSDDPAESVMQATGFRNYGYFWRTFKKIYGLSPQDYRKIHKPQ